MTSRTRQQDIAPSVSEALRLMKQAVQSSLDLGDINPQSAKRKHVSPRHLPRTTAHSLNPCIGLQGGWDDQAAAIFVAHDDVCGPNVQLPTYLAPLTLKRSRRHAVAGRRPPTGTQRLPSGSSRPRPAR